MCGHRRGWPDNVKVFNIQEGGLDADVRVGGFSLLSRLSTPIPVPLSRRRDGKRTSTAVRSRDAAGPGLTYIRPLSPAAPDVSPSLLRRLKDGRGRPAFSSDDISN